MINYLFEKKTKWVPLVAYNYGGSDFIVMVRKGEKSGMLYFKTKKVTPFMEYSYNFRGDLFDIREQFNKILNEQKL